MKFYVLLRLVSLKIDKHIITKIIVGKRVIKECINVCLRNYNTLCYFASSAKYIIQRRSSCIETDSVIKKYSST